MKILPTEIPTHLFPPLSLPISPPNIVFPGHRRVATATMRDKPQTTHFSYHLSRLQSRPYSPVMTTIPMCGGDSLKQSKSRVKLK